MPTSASRLNYAIGARQCTAPGVSWVGYGSNHFPAIKDDSPFAFASP